MMMMITITNVVMMQKQYIPKKEIYMTLLKNMTLNDINRTDKNELTPLDIAHNCYSPIKNDIISLIRSYGGKANCFQRLLSLFTIGLSGMSLARVSKLFCLSTNDLSDVSSDDVLPGSLWYYGGVRARRDIRVDLHALLLGAACPVRSDVVV